MKLTQEQFNVVRAAKILERTKKGMSQGEAVCEVDDLLDQDVACGDLTIVKTKVDRAKMPTVMVTSYTQLLSKKKGKEILGYVLGGPALLVIDHCDCRLNNSRSETYKRVMALSGVARFVIRVNRLSSASVPLPGYQGRGNDSDMPRFMFTSLLMANKIDRVVILVPSGLIKTTRDRWCEKEVARCPT